MVMTSPVVTTTGVADVGLVAGVHDGREGYALLAAPVVLTVATSPWSALTQVF